MTEHKDEAVALIDRWFPVAAVDDACGTTAGSGQSEKAIFTWFASRPIAQARAAVMCSLLTEEGDDPDTDTVAVVERAIRTGAADALDEVAARIPDVDGNRPVVLDCFSGRGIIPLEAARIGVRSVGIDLSPVAVLASRLLADYPLRDWSADPDLPWRGQDGGEIDAQDAPPRLLNPGKDEPKLVADLRRLFAEVDRRVETALRPYFPRNPDGSYPWGYFWAVTIPCDKCKRRFPLIDSLVLRHPWVATADPGQAIRVIASENANTWSVVVESGRPTGSATFSAAAGKKGKSARCPFPACGHVHPLDTVKAKGFAEQFKDAPLAACDLVAVAVTDQKKGKTRTIERKVFRELRPDEREAALAINLDQLEPFGDLSAAPTERIAPGNNHAIRASAYGYKTFSELMNDRQTLLFIETVRAIRACHSEAIAAGLSAEYAAALSAYATSNLVRRLRRATRGAALEAYGDRPAVGVSDVFTNQSYIAFSFSWFEPGPGDGPGTWASLTDTTLTPLRNHLAGLTKLAAPGRFRPATATALPYRDDTVDVVVCDPPYYKMIDYADISDLFYVWARRCLFDILPDLFAEPGEPSGLQDKTHEIIVKDSAAATGDHRTNDWYEEQMAVAFGEMRRVLKPGGTLTVVFGHSDPAAWRRLLGALREAGFVVTSAWPARTESGTTGVASIKVTVAIGCHVAPEGRVAATAAQVEREIIELVRKRVPKWDQWGLALSDQLMASYGPAMQIVGRYRSIQRPDGAEPDLDHFLTVGRRAVADAHAFKVDELPLDTFDPVTRFSIFWLRAFKRTLVPKGEAVFHAQTGQMKVDDLRPHILQDGEGGYRITIDAPPPITERSPVIHVARAMAVAWLEGGTEAVASAIAASARPADDPHLWAAVAELVRQLPESDKVSVALTACQRNRRPIEVAARQTSAQGEQQALDPTGEAR